MLLLHFYIYIYFFHCQNFILLIFMYLSGLLKSYKYFWDYKYFEKITIIKTKQNKQKKLIFFLMFNLFLL